MLIYSLLNNCHVYVRTRLFKIISQRCQFPFCILNKSKEPSFQLRFSPNRQGIENSHHCLFFDLTFSQTQYPQHQCVVSFFYFDTTSVSPPVQSCIKLSCSVLSLCPSHLNDCSATCGKRDAVRRGMRWHPVSSFALRGSLRLS